jgi:hypothetical protein
MAQVAQPLPRKFKTLTQYCRKHKIKQNTRIVLHCQRPHAVTGRMPRTEPSWDFCFATCFRGHGLSGRVLLP